MFESSIICDYNAIKQRPLFFQLIFLLTQISAKKLQDHLFKLVFINYCLFILTFNFFNNTFVIILPKLPTTT